MILSQESVAFGKESVADIIKSVADLGALSETLQHIHQTIGTIELAHIISVSLRKNKAYSKTRLCVTKFIL